MKKPVGMMNADRQNYNIELWNAKADKVYFTITFSTLEP